MHRNRLLYDLPEYQAKVRARYNRLGVFCMSKSDDKCFIFKPVPSTPFIPEGRKKYFKKLYFKVRQLNTNKKFSFATLTYSSSKFSQQEIAVRVKHDLDLFFKRLNYRKSKPQYFYILELTKQNIIHIHLIFDRYVDKKKIFMSWFKVTGCTSINIKSLSYQNAIQYCIKYLSKSKRMNEDYWSFIFKNIDRLWSCSRKMFNNSYKPESNLLFGCLYSSNSQAHHELFGNDPNDLFCDYLTYDDFSKIVNEFIYDFKILRYNFDNLNNHSFIYSKKRGCYYDEHKYFSFA